MDSPKNATHKHHRRRRKFTLVVVTFLVPVLLTLAVYLMIPVFLSSSAGNSFVANKINESVDGTVDFESFKFSWSNGVAIDNLTFQDSHRNQLLDVKHISAKPRYFALLKGQIYVDDAVIDSPTVVIDAAKVMADTKAAPSTPDQKDKPKESTTPDKESGKEISLENVKLTVKNANVTINTGVDTQPFIFSDGQLSLDIKPVKRKSTFDLSMRINGSGQPSAIAMKGHYTPASSHAAFTDSDLELDVKVDKFNLMVLKPVFALMGQDIEAEGILDAIIEARIENAKLEKLKIQTNLQNFKSVIAGKTTKLDKPLKIDANISSLGDSIKIDNLSLTSSFMQIDCTSESISSVKYIAKADLMSLQDFAGQFIDFGPYQISGRVTEEGTAVFKDNTLSFMGKAHVERLIINNKTASSAQIEDLKVDFDISADTAAKELNITTMKIAASPDIASIAITDSLLPWSDDKEKFKLNASAEFDIEKVLPFAAVATTLPKDLQVKGHFKSDLSVTDERGGWRIFTDNTAITDLFVKNEKLPEPFKEKRLGLGLDFFLTKTATGFDKKARLLKIDSTYLDLDGNFEKLSTNGQTTVRADALAKYDLTELSKLVAAFLPEGFSVEGKRSDRVKFFSQYPDGADDKLIENSVAQATFGFDKAVYKGMTFGEAELNTKIQDGIVTIDPFAVKVNEGKINLQGQVNLTSKPMLLTINKPIQIVEKVHINDDMNVNLLKHFNPIFSGATNVNGIVNFTCEKLSMPLASDNTDLLEMEGILSIDDLSLKTAGFLQSIVSLGGRTDPLSTTDMAILPTKFTYKNDTLAYDDMQINIGDNPLNFSGRIGPNSKLKLKLITPYKISASGGKIEIKAVKVSEKAENRFKIDVGGTTDSPQINFDNLFNSLIEDTASELLTDQLNKFLKKSDKKSDDDSEDKSDDKKDDSSDKKTDIEQILEDIDVDDVKDVLEQLFK